MRRMLLLALLAAAIPAVAEAGGVVDRSFIQEYRLAQRIGWVGAALPVGGVAMLGVVPGLGVVGLVAGPPLANGAALKANAVLRRARVRATSVPGNVGIGLFFASVVLTGLAFQEDVLSPKAWSAVAVGAAGTYAASWGFGVAQLVVNRRAARRVGF